MGGLGGGVQWGRRGYKRGGGGPGSKEARKGTGAAVEMNAAAPDEYFDLENMPQASKAERVADDRGSMFLPDVDPRSGQIPDLTIFRDPARTVDGKPLTMVSSGRVMPTTVAAWDKGGAKSFDAVTPNDLSVYCQTEKCTGTTCDAESMDWYVRVYKDAAAQKKESDDVELRRLSTDAARRIFASVLEQPDALIEYKNRLMFTHTVTRRVRTADDPNFGRYQMLHITRALKIVPTELYDEVVAASHQPSATLPADVPPPVATTPPAAEEEGTGQPIKPATKSAATTKPKAGPAAKMPASKSGVSRKRKASSTPRVDASLQRPGETDEAFKKRQIRNAKAREETEKKHANAGTTPAKLAGSKGKRRKTNPFVDDAAVEEKEDGGDAKLSAFAASEDEDDANAPDVEGLINDAPIEGDDDPVSHLAVNSMLDQAEEAREEAAAEQAAAEQAAAAMSSDSDTGKRSRRATKPGRSKSRSFAVQPKAALAAGIRDVVATPVTEVARAAPLPVESKKPARTPAATGRAKASATKASATKTGATKTGATRAEPKASPAPASDAGLGCMHTEQMANMQAFTRERTLKMLQAYKKRESVEWKERRFPDLPDEWAWMVDPSKTLAERVATHGLDPATKKLRTQQTVIASIFMAAANSDIIPDEWRELPRAATPEAEDSSEMEF